MPYIAIKAFPKDEAIKRRVAERIKQVFLEEWGCSQQAISISMKEVAPDDWDSQVRHGEIEQDLDFMLILDGEAKPPLQ